MLSTYRYDPVILSRNEFCLWPCNTKNFNFKTTMTEYLSRAVEGQGIL